MAGSRPYRIAARCVLTIAALPALLALACGQEEPGFRPGPIAGTDECPSWSPDGRFIAFGRAYAVREHPQFGGPQVQSDVYVVGRGGRSARRLTHAATWESVLGWRRSPSEIVFDRANGLYAINPTGRLREHKIGALPARRNSWTLSPGGERLAVFAERQDVIHSDVFVAPVGGGPRVMLPRSYMGGVGWSPDGTRLAYSESDEILITVRSDGRILGRTRGRLPVWSPDTTRIAYLADHDPYKGDYVFLSTPDGRHRRRVALTDDIDLAWFPDGRTIVYGRGEDVRAVRIDGKRDRRLFSTGGDEFDCLAFSPDGRRLAFLRITFVGSVRNGQLVVANSDGSGMRPVSLTPTAG